jgi:hypothetical protein
MTPGKYPEEHTQYGNDVFKTDIFRKRTIRHLRHFRLFLLNPYQKIVFKKLTLKMYSAVFAGSR